MDKISPAQVLKLQPKLPLLDVRTPAEFERGHIPGAINFPIFTDEERVIVGTLYKQEGKEIAIQKGLEMVGPKLADFSQQAKLLAKEKEIMLHCWRGGMRSGSMAWLFETVGLRPKVLAGGYKAYRQSIFKTFDARQLKLKILGGRTGSGKTLILHALRQKGHQIIDLEGLANHKGSSFGAIGEMPQPKTEYFENLLHQAILELDPTQTIWVENESRGIGSVYIPEGFWKQMSQAPIVNITIPDKDRLDILTTIYVNKEPKLLAEAFLRIQKKLGGLNYKLALEALQSNNYREAAKYALLYYDKAYRYGLESKKKSHHITTMDLDYFDAERIAQELVLL